MDPKKIYLDGGWHDYPGDDWIEVENPDSKEILAHVPACGKAEVDRAVAAAKEAYPRWRATPVEERITLLRAGLKELKAFAEDLVELEMDELGQPKRWTKAVHVDRNFARWESFCQIAASTPLVEDLDTAKIQWTPYGVVACITPWNYPLGQVVQKVIPALLAGNTVVLKPSQHTPLSSLYLAEAFHKAKLPRGIFNLVTGRGSEVGDALSGHPDIALVSFTGSTEGGRHVALKAAEKPKPVALELGGKSPSILLPDGDLALAVEGTLASCFNNSGQTCAAYTRFLVPKDRLQEAEDLLLAQGKTWRAGSPRDPEAKLGPLANAKQFEKVCGYIKLGLSEGARRILGDDDFSQPYLVQPTIFSDVTQDMRIAQEEIFGPVLCVLPYATIEEALEIANGTAYGLAGAIYGKTPDQVQTFADRLDAGQIAINGGPRDILAPFGGFKESGYGREGGVDGYMEFLQAKALMF